MENQPVRMAEVVSKTKKPIITTTEARKILGVDGRSLSNDQIEELIATLTPIAEVFLHNNGSKVE